MWVDAHAHLHASQFDRDRLETMARARGAVSARNSAPLIHWPRMTKIGRTCRVEIGAS